jgi:hypothetical protein
VSKGDIAQFSSTNLAAAIGGGVFVSNGLCFLVAGHSLVSLEHVPRLLRISKKLALCSSPARHERNNLRRIKLLRWS